MPIRKRSDCNSGKNEMILIVEARGELYHYFILDSSLIKCWQKGRLLQICFAAHSEVQVMGR